MHVGRAARWRRCRGEASSSTDAGEMMIRNRSRRKICHAYTTLPSSTHTHDFLSWLQARASRFGWVSRFACQTLIQGQVQPPPPQPRSHRNPSPHHPPTPPTQPCPPTYLGNMKGCPAGRGGGSGAAGGSDVKGGGAQGTGGCRHGRGTHEGVGSARARGQATKPSQPSYFPTPARHARSVLGARRGRAGGRGRHGRNSRRRLFGFGLLVCLNVWLAERADLTSSIAATTQSVVEDALAFVWPACVLYWGRRRGLEKLRG